MTKSMTGFASRAGGDTSFSWVIELRSVNSKGLDLRMRLPEQLATLDPVIRADLQKRAARGSVTLSIRLEQSEGAVSLALDEAALDVAIEAANIATRTATAKGLTLSTASPAELLSIPGVMRRVDGSDAEVPLKAVKQDIEAVITEFLAARDAEGKALETVLLRQLSEIAALTTQATTAAEARRPKMEASLSENLARITSKSSEVEPDRVAQELALLAVKADVTEEIDRLQSHVAAGRALLDEDAPVGRRLDFLMQEFNREANTLCSKSGDNALTKCGLELKALIEQMREQVQNVE